MIYSSKRSNSAISLLSKIKLTPSPKTSQTTIFIILSIIIVISIISFFLVNQSSIKENIGREYVEQQGLQPSINNIESFIIDCLKTTSTDSLIKIGVQGGYHNKPEYYFDMEWAFIPYYYYQGLILMPTKMEIENQLSLYMNDNIESCLNKIQFPNFQLSYSQPQTQSTIKPSEVTFKTTLPIIIEHEDDTTNFNLINHQLTLNASLNEIIEVAEFITESHKSNPDQMCINCITELAKERSLFVDFIAINEETTLVMILENRTMEEPYIFEFLNKY